MAQPTRTQAIKNLLIAKTHADLSSLYNHDMEVQVNVARDNGSRIEGDFKGKQWHAWTDGTQTWKSFRIPFKANSTPEYDDRPITFDLALHAEGIGMTGWDWKARKSLWVAFDFDSITGHSEKHAKRLSQAELEDIRNKVESIPWCCLRRSASGSGLHLYVFLAPVDTENHSEHAALARAILGQLSSMTAFDFAAKVDTCGGNMWVWHRKSVGTNGLELMKAHTELYNDPPANWRDHINVITGRRRKILPEFIIKEREHSPDVDRIFEELVGRSSRVPLDEEHTKLLDYLRGIGCSSWWDADHWMLVTHTYFLKQAHENLSLRGVFSTISAGTEAPVDHNCFLFPMRDGAWSVRRYSLGVAEAPTWEQDGSGWSRCFYNKLPDLRSASRTFEGVENSKGGFQFRHAEQAKRAAELLGARVELPTWIMARQAVLAEHTDGRVVFKITEDKADLTHVASGDTLRGWLNEKGHYIRIFDIRARDVQESEVNVLDDCVRHLVTSAGDDCGWLIKAPDGPWRKEPLTHAQKYLASLGFNGKEITSILGSSIGKCWTLVNKPFQDEYPSGREWNLRACQFKHKPTVEKDDLAFPSWLKILQHCGRGLDRDIRDSPWCQSNAILNGGDYLKCWLASLFQQPLEPLPYLFFFGPQGSGKSIFHEAITLLLTHGVVRADKALEDKYNGELANAILCVVEETDLRRNKQAYNKIKDWVTATHISIRALYETPYMIPNATHWVQCANDHLSCPIFPGDTRITYIYVPPLEPDQLIPKKTMFPLLEREASDFLAELISLELPPTTDRLNIPVISTEEKFLAIQANQSLLAEFLQEHCFHVTGRMIKFSDFYSRFTDWLDPHEVRNWSKIKVGRELPPQFPRGRVAKDEQQWYIGNMAWEPYDTSQGLVLPAFVRKGEKLIPETDK